MMTRLGRLGSSEMDKLTKTLREKVDNEDESHVQIEDEMNKLVSMGNTLKSLMAKSEIVDIAARPATENMKTLIDRKAKAMDTCVKAKKSHLEVMKELYPADEGNKIKCYLPPAILP